MFNPKAEDTGSLLLPTAEQWAQYAMQHFCEATGMPCSRNLCVWQVPWKKSTQEDSLPMGPCKSMFKEGFCRCSVEHHNRKDKKVPPCPFEHWVRRVEEVLEDVTNEDGTKSTRPTGRWQSIWLMVKKEALKTPLPSSGASVQGILSGNKSEVKNKAQEREGADLVRTGREHREVGRQATHEVMEANMSALDRLNVVMNVQQTMEKGADLVEEGKSLMGEATHRRQATTWGIKKS